MGRVTAVTHIAKEGYLNKKNTDGDWLRKPRGRLANPKKVQQEKKRARAEEYLSSGGCGTPRVSLRGRG